MYVPRSGTDGPKKLMSVSLDILRAERSVRQKNDAGSSIRLNRHQLCGREMFSSEMGANFSGYIGTSSDL